MPIPAIIQTASGGGAKGVRVSYCPLEEAYIMLLSPRERVLRPPYSDTWTRLYTTTKATRADRFPIQHVVEKIMVSLETYKVPIIEAR